MSETNQSPKPTTNSATLLDYRALKAVAHDELSDLYDHNLSIGCNLLLLLSESIRFTNRRLFEPIVATYLMLPSALCDTLPYLGTRNIIEYPIE